ncbi:MAG: DUF998 domain-containing protein [Rhodobacteraceae bacterium]|nr:DUF998 domain-containing protein [Paracoccaceae bacterium]
MPKGKSQEATNDLVLSFKAVRQALGWIGALLPVALILGGAGFDHHVAASISDTYYTAMKDVFVGAMCATGVFLVSYRGYDRAPDEFLSDTWISRIAGAAAIGLALMPTAPALPEPTGGLTAMQRLIGPGPTSVLHFTCAALFFAMLATFCLFLFTRTGTTRAATRAKINRNRVYRSCGWVLVGVILAVLAMKLIELALPASTAVFRSWSAMFILEAIGVWAFGLSWLVKGESIGFLND